MRIKITVQNPTGVQMLAGSGQARRQIQHQGQGEALTVRVNVPRARRQTGRAGQIPKLRIDPRHHQAAGAGWVADQFTKGPDQMSVMSRSQTGRHLFCRKPIAGDRTLKQFHGHGLPGVLRRRLPVSFMDHSRGAFAELFSQNQIRPLQTGHGRTRGLRRR
ncbi:hypothetical protein LBMAG41_25350 [Cyanobium sp.]|nr:hypothetical protein LBMAG41_25350 [Cyanobium sp.]